MYSDAGNRIAKGEALLDKRFGPTWDERIDLATLNIADSNRCVLGQLFGHYATGCTAFHLYVGVASGYGFAGSELNELWCERITARRAARAERAPTPGRVLFVEAA